MVSGNEESIKHAIKVKRGSLMRKIKGYLYSMCYSIYSVNLRVLLNSDLEKFNHFKLKFGELTISVKVTRGVSRELFTVTYSYNNEMKKLHIDTKELPVNKGYLKGDVDDNLAVLVLQSVRDFCVLCNKLNPNSYGVKTYKLGDSLDNISPEDEVLLHYYPGLTLRDLFNNHLRGITNPIVYRLKEVLLPDIEDSKLFARRFLYNPEGIKRLNVYEDFNESIDNILILMRSDTKIPVTELKDISVNSLVGKYKIRMQNLLEKIDSRSKQNSDAFIVLRKDNRYTLHFTLKDKKRKATLRNVTTEAEANKVLSELVKLANGEISEPSMSESRRIWKAKTAY